MFNPKNDYPVGSRRSCSVDEAVARLLGWMNDDKRRKYVEITEDGRSADQPPYLNSLEGSIVQVLSRLLEQAKLEYKEAEAAEAPSEVIVKKGLAVCYWEAETLAAASYVYAIFQELAKEAESALLLDHLVTWRHKQLFIYFSDLDRWAQRKYDCSAFQSPKGTPLHGVAHAQSKKAAKDNDQGALSDADRASMNLARSKAIRKENAAAKFVKREESDGLSRVETDNLYVVLARLIEGYAGRKGDRYNKTGGGINVSNVAKDAMKLIEEATKEDEELPGQGGRTVRGHMDEALKTKNRVHKLHYGRQTLSQQFTAVPMGESCSEDPPK